MADTYIHKPFAISKTLKMVTRSESSFLISSWSYSDKTLEDWLIYPMPQHDAPSSFATLSQIWCLATDLWNFFMPRFFRDFHQTLSRFTLTVTVTPSICTCRCLISIFLLSSMQFFIKDRSWSGNSPSLTFCFFLFAPVFKQRLGVESLVRPCPGHLAAPSLQSTHCHLLRQARDQVEAHQKVLTLSYRPPHHLWPCLLQDLRHNILGSTLVSRLSNLFQTWRNVRTKIHHFIP